MRISPTEILDHLKAELDRLNEQKATGILLVQHEGIPLRLFLLSGRLQYVTDSEHRMRRWKRAIFQHCQEWVPPTQILNSQPWEYDFLYQGISKSKLTLEQAKQVVSTVAAECWSELALAKDIDIAWSPGDRLKSTFSYFLSLSLAEIHPDLRKAAELHQTWHQANLDQYRPTLSPTLTAKGNTLNNPAIQKYLNGQFTVWDVALQLKQPIAKVMQALITWQTKGLIEFKTIADLPAPVEEMEETPAPQSFAPTAKAAVSTSSISQGSPAVRATGLGKLVACIDDSPIVVHNLKRVLEPAGFQVLSIQEPMAGFGTLIEHKPDLILLDLNMPNANGYSVCKFLRETPVFGKTPIIILTAQDNVIDRTRAKLAGANDFISKPPEPQALIKLLHSYLSVVNSGSVNSGFIPQTA